MTFANGPYSVSALLELGGAGALVDFVSGDRSRTDGGKTCKRLPREAEAAWGPRESRWVYARFEAFDAGFNAGPRA